MTDEVVRRSILICDIKQSFCGQLHFLESAKT